MYSAFVVITTILLLLLPVWVLLLIFKRSSKPSRWKYPPTKRVTQFLFSLGNVVFAVLIILPFVMFLFISLSSGWGVVIGLSIIVLGMVSLLALFRPAYTKGILFVYVMIGVFSYYASPTRELPTTYNDICNELREDPNCKEEDKVFNCVAPSKHAGKRLDKSICVNATSGNSEYDFEGSFSEYEGETHFTKIPLLYIRNLPRNNCKHRSCGYKVDTILEDFRNSCSNCLDPQRLTTRLRIELIPVGTKIKVIDTFQLKKTFFSLSGSDHKILLVEDGAGNRSEISDLVFKMRVIDGNRNWDESLEKTVLGDLEKLEKKAMVTRNFCFMSREGEMAVIESHLKKFLKDFDLESDVQYLPFIEKPKTKWTSTEHCSDITFMTKNSYLLAHYYFHEWHLR